MTQPAHSQVFKYALDACNRENYKGAIKIVTVNCNIDQQVSMFAQMFFALLPKPGDEDNEIKIRKITKLYSELSSMQNIIKAVMLIPMSFQGQIQPLWHFIKDYVKDSALGQIDKVLERGEQIEDAVKRSNDLKATSNTYKKRSLTGKVNLLSYAGLVVRLVTIAALSYFKSPWFLSLILLEVILKVKGVSLNIERTAAPEKPGIKITFG